MNTPNRKPAKGPLTVEPATSDAMARRMYTELVEGDKVALIVSKTGLEDLLAAATAYHLAGHDPQRLARLNTLAAGLIQLRAVAWPDPAPSQPHAPTDCL